MLRVLEQKRVLFFLIIGLSIVLSVGAGDVQANEYENRLKQAEQVAEQLIKPNIAVFDLHGNTDLKKMTLDLIKVAKDPKIHGILLWIDFNGGGAALTTSIHDTLLRIGKIKPIVALARGNALSAGYHIATAAHYIFAHSASQIGSIGTVSTVRRFKNAKVKEDGVEADVEVTLFKGGKYKLITSPFGSDLTEDEKSEMQRGIDMLTERFIANVARSRNLDITKAHEWADARVFIAHEAVELGLIDEVGTAFEGEAKMVELIRGKNPDKLVKGEVEYLFFDCVAPAPSK